MPIGILGSLAICTVIYVIVGLVATGLVPYAQLKGSDPLARAFEVAGITWGQAIISLGAVGLHDRACCWSSSSASPGSSSR